MKHFTIGASVVVALAALVGAHHTTSAQMTAQKAQGRPAVAAQAVSLARYIGGGGGPYWSFELTNNGRGFKMRHPGPGTTEPTHIGAVTSQTNLTGNNWLIEGRVGTRPITVLIERVGTDVCDDGHIGGEDIVRVVWDGYLYKGCGNLN